MFSQIKHVYHKRLFLGLVVYSWLLVGCFAVFQYHREKAFKAEELNGKLQLINGLVIAHLDSTDTVKLPPTDMKGLRLSVIDEEGKVIYDNSLDTLPQASHLQREEIVKALAHGEGYALRRHSESTGKTYFYSAKQGGRYLVRTAVPYSVTLDELLEADIAFLWFMVGATVLMCIFGYFATRRIGTHIERLKEFAEKAERGERITDTQSFPHDELGEISHHIVRLYIKFQQAIAERDKEHRQALLQEQEKIRIKRDLTNNINHELKTPVAAMQICLETLMDNKELDEKKRDEFILRCYDANKRLQTLLTDVATLTRIEDGGELIERGPQDLTAIIDEVCKEYRLVAEAKGMEIHNRVDRPLTVPGNDTLLSSIFRNLMTNAIAYSEGNSIDIDIDHENDKSVTISFADNGRGVDTDHLERIFERFYRIDKGRSRQMGGTGLGLSIVKNAIRWHEGHISVENSPRGGLRFILTFYKNFTSLKQE